ncbi:IS1634 family transposase [Patescibacteria group bacterium]|nr:IS1634 family transposase [Patescibacteria group bacterium]MBU1682509.1 IS1634 family transposase [Patescibacteria group bacterium]
MFVRKNRNRSGSVSVQIISKEHKKYRVVETIGTSKDPEEIERLVVEAKNRINYPAKQTQLFSTLSKSDLAIKNFLAELSNSQIHTIGPELIFGMLFDRLGFGIIKEKLFRHIVIARLAYPTSKLKTVDYLYRYRGIATEIDTVYRFLDKLQSKHKETVERVAYEYTKRTLKNISVVFYDMTTLYFEAEDEDDLRKIGFSKDGKFQKPQIMLGLLVGQDGYPIGYNIFEGNTFEGHTLLPTLKEIEQKYGFKKPIVIADAALLSKDNLKNLGKQKYQFILGARIKNESNKIKQKILEQAKRLEDDQGFSIKKPDGTRLVVTYSDKRQKKDAHNRTRGLRKLRQRVKSGRLTKESINNRGYNKFLTLEGEITVEIDEDKVKEDQKWDGLKGYITNTRLSPKKIVENYRHLWQIEKAFRISKTDLKIRPIYHYLKRRIEAHICIAFVAYTIYKELERLLYKHNAGFSPKRAAELTHNMYELEYTLPHAKKTEKKILKMDEEQLTLHKVIYR